ncbi:MAG: GNAT family N-acetyltransferase, partial [Mesorhizobium sp.]
APYTALLGAPPIPVTEDYAPRIARGEVWVLESGGGLAGLITLERHDDHAMIFSVAVSPDFQGKGFGIALL